MRIRRTIPIVVASVLAIVCGILRLRASQNVEFFNAMLKRWPDRRMGASTLWAGASALYAHGGDVV